MSLPSEPAKVEGYTPFFFRQSRSSGRGTLGQQPPKNIGVHSWPLVYTPGWWSVFTLAGGRCSTVALYHQD